MPNRSLSLFAVLALVIVAVVASRSPLWTGPTAPPSNPPGSGSSPSGGTSDPRTSGPAHPSRFSNVGFRSPERLDEHYHKHGREFGDVSIEQYLHMAQALRDKPAGGPVLEAVGQRDGHDVVSKFDKVSGAFVAFDRADGVIRTFFRPNDGEAYFHRQAAREGHEVGGGGNKEEW